ncbi:MAG: FAD-dependent monooxygenase [Myxococcaceae bacterium]
MDVLIVGAGPTGLSLAVNLLQAGIRVRLVDAEPERSHHSRALAVQARTLELFEKIGIAEPLVAQGTRAFRISAFAKGQQLFHLEIPDIGVDDSPFPFILFVSQYETERALERKLLELGGQVERPTRLLEFREQADHVIATLERDGAREELRTSYIVGCDGAHSTVRKSLGLEFAGATYPQTFLLGDVDVEWSLPKDQLNVFLGDDGVLAAFPLRGNQIRAIVATSEFEHDRDPTLEELQTLARRYSQTALTFKNPEWLASYRIHHRGVERYRVGRAFLAGDAAHIHSPAGGQGMNTGIQDAWNLGWKLALVLRGEARDALLDSYERERLPVGRMLLRVTDRLFGAVTTRNPVVIAARNALAPRLAPWFFGNAQRRRRAFRFVSELGIKYRESPIVGEPAGPHDAAFERGAAAGDRAPDAPLQLPDGARSHLFEVISGPAHHLLVFVPPGHTVPTEQTTSLTQRLGLDTRVHVVAFHPDGPVFVDTDGLVRQRYGIRSEGLVLIRPDGHIAYRTEGLDFDALVAHVAQAYRSGAAS